MMNVTESCGSETNVQVSNSAALHQFILCITDTLIYDRYNEGGKGYMYVCVCNVCVCNIYIYAHITYIYIYIYASLDTRTGHLELRRKLRAAKENACLVHNGYKGMCT